MSSRKVPETALPPFDKQAAETVTRLRSTFAAIVDALPQRVSRASELQHALQIDKILGWRIYSVIRCADPFAAARYVPGSGGVKIFLNAAEKQGVPPAVTQTAAAALADYERLVRTHAGDRKSLELMLGAHSDEGRAELDLSQRRLAFRANSYIWGLWAAVQLRAAFVGFSSTPGEVDLAALRGFIGLQRVRPNVRCPIGWATCVDDHGQQRRELALEPLYDVANPDQAAARIFLSQPPPAIECVSQRGALQYELLPGPVGKTGAITCVTGELMSRAGPYVGTQSNLWATYTTRVRTPSELLIFDQFVDAALYGRFEPELLVYGHIQDGPRAESDRLPMLERATYLGNASGVLHTPEVPHYRDMVRFVFDRLGWDARRFDVYRIRMEYPVMPSEVKMRNLLRREPGQHASSRA